MRVQDASVPGHLDQAKRQEILERLAQRSHADFAGSGVCGAAFDFNSAKMSRPAAVCNALETTTATVLPICGRAWFTTIMVPSGK